MHLAGVSYRTLMFCMCVWKYWIVKISMNSLLQSPCSLMRLKGQRQNVLFLFEIFSPPDFQLSKPFLNSKLIHPISIRKKIERKLKVVRHSLNLFSSWISIVSPTVSLCIITIPSCLQPITVCSSQWLHDQRQRHFTFIQSKTTQMTQSELIYNSRRDTGESSSELSYSVMFL